MNNQEYGILRKYKYSEHPRVLFFLGCLSFFMGIFYGSNGIDRYDAVFLLFPIILTIFVGVRILIQVFLIFAMSIAGYIF
jgi:hypothetical protein